MLAGAQAAPNMDTLVPSRGSSPRVRICCQPFAGHAEGEPEETLSMEIAPCSMMLRPA